MRSNSTLSWKHLAVALVLLLGALSAFDVAEAKKHKKKKGAAKKMAPPQRKKGNGQVDASSCQAGQTLITLWGLSECRTCAAPCATCSNNNLTYCGSCIPNASLKSNTCTCNSGYSLVNNVCTKCTAPCKECSSGSSTSCTACTYPDTLDGTRCNKCGIQYCNACSNGACTQCMVGYYPSQFTRPVGAACSPCPDFCKTCTGFNQACTAAAGFAGCTGFDYSKGC